MPNTSTDRDIIALQEHVDKLEATVNGLLIYVAAMEEKLAVDLGSEATRRFLTENVARSFDSRFHWGHAIPADGFLDGQAILRIRKLREKLKAAEIA